MALVRAAPSVGRLESERNVMRYQTKIDSPIGTLTLIADEDALTEVRFPNERYDDDAEVVDVTDHPVLEQAAGELGEYFEGRRVDFDVPLEPRGTAFQLAAWQALRTIPYGETVSYGEQAKRARRPRQGQGRRRRQRSQPAPDHRPVPPCGRRQRSPHRIRRRHRDQGLAPRPRTTRPRTATPEQLADHKPAPTSAAASTPADGDRLHEVVHHAGEVDRQLAFGDVFDFPADGAPFPATPVIVRLAFDRAVLRVDVDFEDPADRRDRDVEADRANSGEPLGDLALDDRQRPGK